MNRYNLLVLLISMYLFACSQQKAAINDLENSVKSDLYANPVVPGDFADPSVILVGNTYYSVGTSSEWGPHFPVLKSKDLVNWDQIGFVFEEKPSWAASSFWAPELFYHDNKFYVYYVAKREDDGISVIGLATAKNPEEGFTDHGVVVEFGEEAIDPFVFKDGGQLYMTWKAYGLDERPIELLGSKLSDDGRRIQGKPFKLIEDENRRGIEGQYIMKKDGYYYLFYSEGACCGRACDYDVRVARAKSIQGPYEKYKSNPIMAANDVWKCPGHGTIVETADNRYYYMYHAYSQKDDVYTGRQGLLDEVYWNKETGWPYFENTSPSVHAELPVPEIPQKKKFEFTDQFSSSVLAQNWQWDFRHAVPEVKLEEGVLCLSGDITGKNITGSALTIRPALGTYEITTEVINRNSSLKGLVVYGDADQSVGIGIKGHMVQLWEVKGKERKILAEKKLSSERPVKLKIAVKDGFKYEFFWNQYEKEWDQLKYEDKEFYIGEYLPQWDRSARPGLVHYGDKTQPACFSYFNLVYGEKAGLATDTSEDGS